MIWLGLIGWLVAGILTCILLMWYDYHFEGSKGVRINDMGIMIVALFLWPVVIIILMGCVTNSHGKKVIMDYERLFGERKENEE